MTAERMLDLEWEFLDGGMLRLEQSVGCGETVLVDLHQAQLRLLCERAGLLKPAPIDLAEHLTAAHIRRLRGLADRIYELYDNEEFFNDIFDECSEGPEWWQYIRTIFEMSQDLLADLGAQGPEAAQPGQADAVVEPGQAKLDLGTAG